MRLIARTLVAAALLCLVLYAGAVGYLVFFQRGFVFPAGGPMAEGAAEKAGLEPVSVPASDGIALVGWYSPPQRDLPTLLYFHGNAGDLSDRTDRFGQVTASGFGLLAMSYRGYGGSEGLPSEAALFEDALSAFDWLSDRTRNIVLYGESLGTGVATYAASEREAAALVLEAPFTAIVDIAAETYPWVPVSYLMWDQFRSRDLISEVQEPLLVVQGTEDEVVPTEQGQRLFELASEPKDLVVIQGGHHGDLWDRGLWPQVLEFLVAQLSLRPQQ